MITATRVTVTTFGVLAGLAGIEHGIGEMLQGNLAPEGLVILSWPEAAFFRILGGEPAMTIVPNLLATGILAIIASLIFIGWAARFAHRPRGGLTLIALSLIMLVVGAGFGPPLLGILLGITAIQMGAPRAGQPTRVPDGFGRVLARLWPWSFGAAVVAWLSLMQGLPLLDYAVGADTPIADSAVYTVIGCAFGFLVLTLATGLSHDNQPDSVPLPRTFAAPVP
jgi:hypothetical protein